MRQIFPGRLIGSDGVIGSCRGKLRDLSGASENSAVVSDEESVFLTLTPFSLKNRPEGELDGCISLVLELSGKTANPLLGALVLTPGKNLIDIKPFAKEFTRISNRN
ncbi:MAG: hypothetical protein LBW85_04615 [Deltaproteobacteria bacterium]|nr:hypothetical protein [Deltaproteobacteria bacterium]